MCAYGEGKQERLVLPHRSSQAKRARADEVPAEIDITIDRVDPILDEEQANAALPTTSSSAHEGDDLVGTTIGDYRLLRRLGSGGMADVYLVEHLHLGCRLALKRLKDHIDNKQGLIGRFFEEARGVSEVCHPNIVKIAGVVRTPEHQCYVMEYLEGQTVEQLLESLREIPVDRAVHIAVQLCGALEVLHDLGIVHRDIKPANLVLIERHGVKDFVKVLDFGSARFLETATGISRNQTEVGMSLGTPGYMAPEQLFGNPVDVRADIYSVGVLLYQMVTGKKPFTGDTWAKLILKQATELPRPPSKVTSAGIPPALDALILKCLALEPKDRPQNVGELIQRLNNICSDSRSALPFVRRKARSKRRRILYYMAGGLAVAGLIVLAFLTLSSDSRRAKPPGVGDPSMAPAPLAMPEVDTAKGAQQGSDKKMAPVTPLDVSALTERSRKKKKRASRARRRSRRMATASDELFDQFE